MHFQRRSRRPVRVATVGPRFQAPAWVHERRGHRDVGRAIHVSEDGEDLFFCRFVVLGFDDVRLTGYDGDEEDSGTGKEAGAIKRLEDGKVAAFYGVGVEKELGRGVPKNLVGRKLHEDLGVSTHRESFDALLFPGRE